MEAIIQNVEIIPINEIWKKHKPIGLGFSDTDAIILKLKPKDGKIFTKTFYCRIKADGTLGHSITRKSEKRQVELQTFIKEYISEDKNYNIRENINKWKGKNVTC